MNMILTATTSSFQQKWYGKREILSKQHFFLHPLQDNSTAEGSMARYQVNCHVFSYFSYSSLGMPFLIIFKIFF